MKNVTIHSKIKKLSFFVILMVVGGGVFVAFSLNFFQSDIAEIRDMMISGGHLKAVEGLDEKFTTLASYLKYFSYFILAVSSSVAFFSGISFFWLNKSISSVIRSVINNLKLAYDKVDTMANNVANSSQGLSNSTTEQAASIQETASSIQEISAMVTKNSESALYAQELSKTSQHELNNGQAQVQEMIQVVSEIEKSNQELINYIHESHDKFREIIDVISEISNKTNVINDIVFQTKLLSFNASVEAARAGEHGKGFAVVAEEVGNLAQMSGNSAHEISEMLDMSIEKVNEIIKQTQKRMEILLQQGYAKIQLGTEKAEQTGHVLQGILQSSSEVNSRVEEITTASQEQASGVAEVTRAISELDQTTQQNMKISNQNLDYSTQLQGSSRDLNQVIEDLEKLLKKDKKQQDEQVNAKVVSLDEAKKQRQTNIVPDEEQQEYVEFRQQVGGAPQGVVSFNEKQKNTPALKEAFQESDLGVPSSDDPDFEDL